MTTTIHDGWIELLLRYPWDWKMDLTTRHPQSPERLQKACERLHRILTRCAQTGVDAFFALEQSACGRWHIHALVGCDRPLNPKLLRTAWKAGFTEVQRVTCPRTAVWYASKSASTSTEHLLLLLSRRSRRRFDAK